MAHFAELNSSKEVLRVIVVSNDDVNANGGDLHADAETFVASIVPHGTGGASWKQTSYNTKSGVHKLGGTPFRKNYAGRGYTYDEARDAFIPPKPYPSWTLNGTTCLWDPPVAYPNDGKEYNWNESTTSWDEIVS